MLQNKSVNDWLKLVKTNSTNIMQTLAEKRLNPNNHHLSPDAKKHLRWLYLLYYEKKGGFNDLQQQKEATRKWENNYNFKRPHQALEYLTPMEFYALWKKNLEKAGAIAEKWQEYLRKQRLRLTRARRIKKKEQIDTLMMFIDAKLKRNKQEVEDVKLQLIDCKLCSAA